MSKFSEQVVKNIKYIEHFKNKINKLKTYKTLRFLNNQLNPENFSYYQFLFLLSLYSLVFVGLNQIDVFKNMFIPGKLGITMAVVTLLFMLFTLIIEGFFKKYLEKKLLKNLENEEQKILNDINFDINNININYILEYSISLMEYNKFSNHDFIKIFHQTKNDKNFDKNTYFINIRNFLFNAFKNEKISENDLIIKINFFIKNLNIDNKKLIRETHNYISDLTFKENDNKIENFNINKKSEIVF